MTDQITNPVAVEPSVVDLLISPIESRLKETTEGPWAINSCIADCCIFVASETDTGYQFAGFDNLHNADFIAHARTDVAALIALARHQEKVLADIRELAEMAGNSTETAISGPLLRVALNQTSKS